MKQGSSRNADSRAAGQQIFHVLRKPNVHYCVHNSLSTILNLMNPVHIPIFCFSEIHFNIITVCASSPPNWSPFFKFSYFPTFYMHLSTVQNTHKVLASITVKGKGKVTLVLN